MNGKYLAELVIELCGGDLERALNKAYDIENHILLAIQGKEEQEILDSELVSKIKRVSYSECLEMFKDYGVYNFEADDYKEFEHNLYYDWKDKDEDDYQELNSETEIYWNYSCVKEFIEQIEAHIEANENGLCDLVMLPNGWLQEIPYSYSYNLD